ncbi:magnesium transporter [Pseudodesulfovibrio senegalensis]|uniref:Magnesium transporter MgtE n=1 Tax=Pseudodesulfovibrio senegalensis TaxID=1721087 RepID=A0A6N6N5L9_9BACT|nr:magnesium transporter [Pseudodesulfovibrio senegalensis]KAB1443354.1 magnesium transporter [Pseudodesulfovibrio senegalensis]
MRNSFSSAELQRLLHTNDHKGLTALCEAAHPASVAHAVAEFGLRDSVAVFDQLPLHVATDVFSHLHTAHQERIMEGLSRRRLTGLVSSMQPDDRAALLRSLPDRCRDAILPGLAQAERDDILRLMAYPSHSAGAVMTSEYVSLAPQMSAREAIDTFRLVAPDRETVYYAYVLDDDRKLVGVLSLRELILARPESLVHEIMKTRVLSVRAEQDREEAVEIIARYNLLALPVLDEQDRLVGIITHDDALDVLQNEHTEDMEKFMAIGGRHETGTYVNTPSWRHFVNRAPWVMGLAVLGLVSGSIIHSFEDSLMHLVILALYMPMLADTGGNTGSQSATVVIRAIALGEVKPGDGLRIMFKELKISLLLAAVLSVMAFGKVLLLSHGVVLPVGISLYSLGLAVAVALGVQVVTATLVGAMLPMIASRLRMDPAVVASPALTTVVDITGLLIYFTTARLLLGV